MIETIYGTNLQLLQKTADYSVRSILGRLDKSLNPATAFVVIDPNLLIGTGAMNPSELKELTSVLGKLDSEIVEKGFVNFKKTIEEIEEILASYDASLKAPFNWYKQRWEKQRSIGLTLESIFNSADASNDRIYFTDRAVYREEDRVFVCAVITLDRKSYDSHYRLSKLISFNDASTSLLDLIINQLLQAYYVALLSPRADINEFVTRARNVLTDSARAMMTFHFRRRTRSRRPTNMDLFGGCNAIAALPYESKGGTGKMIIAERRHPNIEIKIHFKNSIRLSDHQMARKLLEMAQGEMCLLTDTRQIYGLGANTGSYDEMREDLFTVEFVKQHSWRLLHAKHELMTVTLGRPKLPVPLISEEVFSRHFHRHFSRRDNTPFMDLHYKMIEATAGLQHGALLVISDRAEQEAKRLGGQAVLVKPFEITVDNIPRLAAIDGAVLIDSAGMCHAVGVILDGQAVKTGDRSRGSRFNSAHRYIVSARKKRHSCIAVVVSEDGPTSLL
jgi:DNA integrity scanning protein DisA with diadenylate cyclase activity